MSPTLRDESEALWIALEAGLVGVDLVVAWADAHISKVDRPDALLCEISLSGGGRPSDVARMLARLPGEPDRVVVAGLLAKLMYDLLKDSSLPRGRIGDALILAVARGWIADPLLKGAASWAPNQRDLDDVSPDGAPSEAAIDRMSRSFSGDLSRRLARAASTTARWTIRPWFDSLADGNASHEPVL